ncbi:MAG: regulatory protein RecX [Chlamydiota bacterium]
MKRKAAAGRGDGGVVEYPKAMDIALNLLGFRSRTERELGKRLKEKGVDGEVAARVCARLKEIGYLDDRKFALEWIKARSGAKCRSAWVLKRELREKGIDAGLADETVSECLDGRDVFEEACALARRRVSRPGSDDPEKLRAKLQSLLLRRGFDYEFIRRVIAETAPRGAGDEE